MAITGAPDSVFLGGSYSTGPQEGVYHVIVQEAALGESQKSKRPQLVLDLFGKDDGDHPAKAGKRVTKMFQSLPMPADDKDKADVMKGLVKRLVFDGFGLKWSTEPKAFDPRQLQGKEAWILIAPKKDDKGEFRNQVVAVSQDKSKLPQLKGAETKQPTSTGRTSRRSNGVQPNA